ncbi:MAG: rRNA pseudouridine synthase [Lentisphaeria bacterium]|nr:rRNA pseudouridine synthase [Lentisphaeria bacterium]
MRLDKYIADSSAYSRSEIRKLVRYRAVTVNGTVAPSADLQIGETDEVRINGKRIEYRKYVYLMLNKPQGYLSATEDKHDPVVTELVPEEYRHFKVFPVGRLDKDTEGLLLLTNDGQFDHAVMSPKKKVMKRYYAELDGPVAPEDIELFAAGMVFPDFTARPARLETTDDPNRVFIEIAEGKFHQVKRMCQRIGREVLYLKRVKIGALALDERLAPGEMRELTPEEFRLLTETENR